MLYLMLVQRRFLYSSQELEIINTENKLWFINKPTIHYYVKEWTLDRYTLTAIFIQTARRLI